MTEKNRLFAIGYIVVVFFVLPVTVLGIQKVFGNKNPAVVAAETDEVKLEAVEQEVERTEFAIE